MRPKPLLISILTLSFSAASMAACNQCEKLPYKFDLDGESAIAAKDLVENLQKEGFKGSPIFTFRWDGDEVRHTMKYSPRPIGSLNDTKLYDRQAFEYNGYISELELGGKEVITCLNDYSFELTDTTIYGVPVLKSQDAIWDLDKISACKEKVDLSHLLNRHAIFIKTIFKEF